MKKSALLYIVLASILWGTSGLFSYGLRAFGFHSVQMTAMRGVVSMILMLAFVLIRDARLLRVEKSAIPALIGSGISLFATATAYFASMEASSVSTAVILMYTAPIFVLIYSVLFLGERLSLKKGMSIFLMIVGCALVSGIVGGMKFSLMGIVYGMLSGLTYSAYNIFTKVLTIKKVPTATVTCYNFIIVSIIGITISDPAKIISLSSSDPLSTIPLMVGLGLFTCFLPYVFYTMGLHDIPAGTATSLGIIEPLSATVFSLLFLGETLTIPLVIGMILILGAVFALAKEE